MNGIFAALSVGNVDPTSFVAEASASVRDRNDYMHYDTASGNLSNDPDGLGGQTATRFANLASRRQ